MSAPVMFSWDGEAMVPLKRFQRTCDAEFVIGERYIMQVVEERSWKTHAHQFAWLNEAWANLPEDVAHLYPTPDHLRKRALIEGGFCTEQVVDAGSKAAAIRVAAACRGLDDFAFVTVDGPIVTIRRAKSQSMRAMGKQEFQASKTAVLEIVAAMIGVAPETLQREGGRAAA